MKRFLLIVLLIPSLAQAGNDDNIFTNLLTHAIKTTAHAVCDNIAPIIAKVIINKFRDPATVCAEEELEKFKTKNRLMREKKENEENDKLLREFLTKYHRDKIKETKNEKSCLLM